MHDKKCFPELDFSFFPPTLSKNAPVGLEIIGTLFFQPSKKFLRHQVRYPAMCHKLFHHFVKNFSSVAFSSMDSKIFYSNMQNVQNSFLRQSLAFLLDSIPCLFHRLEWDFPTSSNKANIKRRKIVIFHFRIAYWSVLG